jgi:DNA polymerase I-like protein with 3'-5' exonuclease and polymerase domains
MMAGYMSLDFETSINKTIHGPTFRDPTNDIYTMVYATHPNHVKLLHSKKGFKRKLPFRIGRRLLNNRTIITQNGKFDLTYVWNDICFQQWLQAGGKIWDCQLVRYLLSAQRHTYPSLAELQKLYLGIKTKKDRISYLFKKKGIGADKIINARNRCPRVWKLYCDYGIEDGKTPMLIMQKQYKEAKIKNMIPIIELYNQYLLSLCMIEQNGLNIDLKQAEINEKQLAIQEIEYLEQAHNIAGQYWKDPRLPKLNLNSPDHRSLVLFGGNLACKVKRATDYIYKSGNKKGKHQLESIIEYVIIKGFGINSGLSSVTAKKGFYHTGKPILDKIAKMIKNKDAIEFFKYMQLANTNKKMINTYIRPFINGCINGVLYPNLNNTETITSRLSSSKPNVQNIPSKGKFKKTIQGLIIAPLGWTCCSIDFSQLEVYCRALLSKDKAIHQDLANGLDFHVQNLAWGFGLSYDECFKLCKIDKDPVWDERRSVIGKPITFSEAYGKMEEAMARDTGLSIDIVKHIYQEMRRKYPNIVLFEEQVKKQVEGNTSVSIISDFADKYTTGNKDKQEVARRFAGPYELLPIKKRKGEDIYYFDQDEYRHIGIWASPTGKRYAFEERCTKTIHMDLFKYYRSTEMKNYPMQGTAGDVQGATTVEMFPFLLRNKNKVRLVNEIHDAKWFYIKDEYLSCIVPKLCAIMSSVKEIFKRRFNIDTALAFPCEAKIGKNFAEMREYRI